MAGLVEILQAANTLSLATVFSVGLLGNVLVLTVLCSQRGGTVTNVYVANLAVADALHLLSIPPTLHVMRVGYWPWGQLACKGFYLVYYANWNVSILIITAMSFDRYKAVVSPFTSERYRTRRFAACLLLGLWLLSGCLISPTFLFAEVQEGVNLTARSCSHLKLNASNGAGPGDAVLEFFADPSNFMRYMFVTGCLLPGTLLCCFYSLLLRKLYLLQRGRSQGAQQRFERVTILVVAVVAFYAACCLPHWIHVNLMLAIGPTKWTMVSSHATTLLGYVSSAGNPVLYAFLNDPFRAALASGLAAICGRRRQQAGSCRQQQELQADDRNGGHLLLPSHCDSMPGTTTGLTTFNDTTKYRPESQEVAAEVIETVID